MRAPWHESDVLIGTGGLGSGMFFALEGDETVGREESRGGYLLDSRDFGKLHIVCHYVSVLLGDDLLVVPIGRVGRDAAGESVRRDLRDVGMDTSHVAVDQERPTQFSVCFTYPSGEGGNLTALNSASAEVSSADIQAARPLFKRFAGRGIALAVPEVPIAARSALLSQASEHGFLRVGSFVTGELRTREAHHLLGLLDVLAINKDEAAALADCDPAATTASIVEAATGFVSSRYQQLSLVVTAGRHGSWVWDGRELTSDPGIETEVRNAAGAGDAHLGAVIAGLAAGAGLAQANSFATVVSALKIRSPDTISADLDVAGVVAAAAASGRMIPAPLRERLRPAQARNKVPAGGRPPAEADDARQ
jgi:ribokinase